MKVTHQLRLRFHYFSYGGICGEKVCLDSKNARNSKINNFSKVLSSRRTLFFFCICRFFYEASFGRNKGRRTDVCLLYTYIHAYITTNIVYTHRPITKIAYSDTEYERHGFNDAMKLN
jgi:hypothetical protein